MLPLVAERLPSVAYWSCTWGNSTMRPTVHLGTPRSRNSRSTLLIARLEAKLKG